MKRVHCAAPLASLPALARQAMAAYADRHSGEPAARRSCLRLQMRYAAFVEDELAPWLMALRGPGVADLRERLGLDMDILTQSALDDVSGRARFCRALCEHLSDLLTQELA